MRSCSGRALDAMCFPTAQSQFGAVCVEWRLACRMSLLIRPLERQAKPPAPPCWINRLRSRWGRRFRLPVEADFYRSSKIPKTVNTRLTQRRACPTLCRNAKFSLGGTQPDFHHIFDPTHVGSKADVAGQWPAPRKHVAAQQKTQQLTVRRLKFMERTPAASLHSRTPKFCERCDDAGLGGRRSPVGLPHPLAPGALACFSLFASI